MADKNRIKEFWDVRAVEFGKSMYATLGETYLRKLEISTMLKILKHAKPPLVLEIGCGNGYSTSIYAEKSPKMKIKAIDYSEKMIGIAKENYWRENIEYGVWDITQVDEFPFEIKKFDLIFSQRVIQNLPSWEIQREVTKNLISMLADNGRLCLMECSEEGVNQLNEWRKRIGRSPLNRIIPWHNVFINDSKLKEEFSKDLDKIVYFSSTYMLITRLIPYRIDRVDRIAWLLPSVGKFGYDRLYIFKKKQ